jgi:RNA polymerase sigma-70 factor, ECF subfamily
MADLIQDYYNQCIQKKRNSLTVLSETLTLSPKSNRGYFMLDDNNDRQLVSRLKVGDKKAFEEIFRKYREKIYYFAIRYYNSAEDAENIVQDVFIKLWDEHEGVKEELSLNNYIYTIAKNHLFNIQRKKLNEKAYRNYLVDHLVHIPNLENELIYADLKAKIDEIIDELPAQRKKVFIMSNMEGVSNKELASQLNLSVRTIEVHKSLALQTIRKALKKIST